jgi:trehalose/maltose hydrolase-like predicted phosphorylase
MNGVGTMEHALEPTADAAWLLYEVGYDPLRESSSESRFAISNGFLGVRGSRATTRGARCVVPPRTYVAGLFDTPGAERATLGLVPAADWLQVRILLPGGPLVHHPGDASTHHRTLDVRRGALLSECRQLTAPDVCIRLRTLRLVSLSERAIGLQLIQLEIEHGEVEVTLEASLEGVNLELVSERLEQDLGVGGKGLAMATASSLQIDGHDLPPTALGQLKWSWTWKSRPGQVVCFRTLRRSGAERHPRSGPWQRSA